MSKLIDFLNSSLIDTLREAREDEFQTLCMISERKKPKLYKNDVDTEQELLDSLEENIESEEIKEKIREKMHDFINQVYSDFDIAMNRIYRLGILDGYKLKKELSELLEEALNGEDNE